MQNAIPVATTGKALKTTNHSYWQVKERQLLLQHDNVF